MGKIRSFSAALLCVCAVIFVVQAEFYPERIYRERTKTLLDYGWKFYKGTPTGDPTQVSFNDAAAGWSTVNIPHSASYDEPTGAAELNHYHGDCWYRKTFTVPPALHTGKLFIEFEGAMQSADVWLNGVKLGAHYSSGYTWFSFDMTGKTQGSNVLAVKLNNDYTQQIPPGNVGNRNPFTQNTFPDFHLFSGLYRDVWLVSTDKVYIPLYGQRITTTGVSKTSAKVRVKTKVRNDDAASKNVTLSYLITDSNNVTVLNEELTATIAAGQTYEFDKTSGPISNPTLWSITAPYLYKVYTRVLVDGVATDDYAERFGIRWFEYSLSEGFKLNGDKTVLQGVCLHQSIGWIENALPSSRFFAEVKMCKDMGANMIRCSHFPRDPSFYTACDELGMLLYVEVPTWGVMTTSYPQIFWDRLDTCVREMIEVGFNHPSIAMWGLFNEPSGSGSPQEFSAGITKVNNTAHAQDSTRMTVMANTSSQGITTIPDIVGVNYWIDVAKANENKIRINTEYHPGWYANYTCARCAAREPDFSTQRWGFWTEVRDAMDVGIPTNHTYIGGNMWSFNDYSSVFLGATETPMGVVDYLRVPKQAFYYFRKNWTGKAEDNPSASVTGTKISLEADVTQLVADSTDVTRIIASVRDASNALANAAVDVVFQITGPADAFGPTTLTTKCGKIGLLLKSRNTPGTIKVKVIGSGIASDSLTIPSVTRDVSQLPFPGVGVLKHAAASSRYSTITRHGNIISIAFPSKIVPKVRISLFDLNGKRVVCPFTVRNRAITVSTSGIGTGYYCLQVGDEKGEVYKKFSFINFK